VQWPGQRTGDITLGFGITEDLAKPTPPLAGVDLRVCRFLDPACDHPFAQATTDDAGTAMLQVTAATPPVTGPDQNSYVQATRTGYLTTLFFWQTPVSVERFEPISILGLFTLGEAQAATGAVTYDPTRGIIYFFVLDCSRAYPNAPDVQVTLTVADGGSDPAVRRFYGQTLDFTATKTDDMGTGGFVNVPPGVAQLTATPLALDGGASSRATVLVREATMTWVYLPPTP
jgi:hypothetical protein